MFPYRYGLLIGIVLMSSSLVTAKTKMKKEVKEEKEKLQNNPIETTN